MRSAPKKPRFSRLLLLVAGLALAASAGSAYAQITLRDKTNKQTNINNSQAAAKPPGTVEGDLLIATVSHDIGTGTLGAPGDWILIEPATPGSEAMRTRSWYKVAGASEPSIYTFTSTAAAAGMIVQISSYYSSSGVNAAGWTLEDKSYKYQTGLNTISTTSVTATTDNLFYAAFINDDNESVTSAPPLTVLHNKMTSSTSQATYYDNPGAGPVSESLTWGGTADETAAVAAVFSWTAAGGGGGGDGSCPAPSTLFYDGFESGVLTPPWDGNATATGDTLAVSTEQAKTGTKSAKAVVDTVADAQGFVWENITGETTLYARTYIYLDPSFATTDHITVIQFLNNWTNILSTSIKDDMTLYLWNAVAGEAYGYGTGSTISKGEWHALEMMVTISATAGEARLWLDGNLEIEATGKNLGTNAIDRFATGFYWANPRTEANTIYFDDSTLCLEQMAGSGPSVLTITSSANQTFTVGDPATGISTITVTDDTGTATITAANDLRIRIPATFNMEWDTSITTVTLGGGAAGKVSTTGVTYEDSNKTAVLSVTADFAAGDQVTIADLKFMNFTAASAADNLELVTAGAGGATAATDDKTVTIYDDIAISSAANQIFTVADAATLISTITVTDHAGTPQITAANNLRIRIPATFNMEWDTTITTVTLGGGAAAKVSGTGVTYEDSNKTAVLSVTADFAAGDQVTIADLKFTNFSAASAADNLELVVAGAAGATAATDDKTITIIADIMISSAANQSFTVGDAATAISTITVTDHAGTPEITDANELRIRIPATFNMEWDTSITTVTLGGGAAAKVSGTGVTYEDSNKTAVLNVTADFANGDQITVADLKFTNFTAASAADNLELVVAGAAGATAATDDKTVTIYDDIAISSAANQSFTVGDAATVNSMITVTDHAGTPQITAANDLRIRIPATFNMVWDTSDTSAVIGGAAAAKVLTTVTYEDGGETLVLDVSSDFAAGDQITISGLSFTSFTASSAADNLELVVAGAGGATAATDDKTVAIYDDIAISSGANQSFTVGDAATTISTITVTDHAGIPQVTDANDLRIRIPATFNMTWDTSITTVTLGGGAAAKVNGTGVTYEDANKTAVLNVITDFAAGDQVTIADLKFTNFSAASSADNLELVTAGAAGATAATDDKTITIFADIMISSAANQIFNVGDAATAISTLTVTDHGGTPQVTDANDLRIRIPATFNMEWDTSITTVTLGGGAAAKVSTTGVTYEDSNKTAVLSVITDFAAGDQVTIADLKFTNFSAASSADNLELVVAGAAGATAATDDKIVAIYDDIAISSGANQSFTVGDAATTISTITVTDHAGTPQITDANDLRIRIPATFNMTWDTSITTVTLGGGAAGKVSTTGVTYEDSNKTAVLSVITDFAAGDQVTIADLKFTNFTASSAADNLELVTAGAGGATAATDDKTVAIFDDIAISSAANQSFTVGDAATIISTITVTDHGGTPQVTAANDLRIRIPATFNMEWDTTITTVTLGGGAAGKVSTTGVTYEVFNKTVVLDVTADFAAADQITVSGLKFTNFTASSSADNLELVVAGAAGPTAATDDKTVAIFGNIVISSAANQTFSAGDPPTGISTITIIDDITSPAITAAGDLRIRIPSGFNMDWDTSDTSAVIGGGAASIVSPTVTYEGSKTLVLNVTTDFDAGDSITVSGLSFANFAGSSPGDNLELDIDNDATADATDDKTIQVDPAAATATISSGANQTFTVGDPTTAISTITITDDATTPVITAANDLRIRIPAAFNMDWDTSDTTAVIGGGAASNVSVTVTYDDSKTLVLDVTSNFVASDQITISDLSFTNFTAASVPETLKLDVDNNGSADAGDDKTIQVDTAAGGVCPTVGQGTWYDSAWQYRKAIAIDANDVPADLTDFPVLVDLGADADLTSDARADGDDILFTSSNGTTKLNHEIETFTSATGELVAWVKVPNLSSSTDTVLYMYYGNATAANQQTATGVWDANYQLVAHMGNVPTGAASDIKDATSNANDGTSQAMAGANQVNGKIGGNLQFDGVAEFVDLGDVLDILDPTGFTLEAWIDPTTINTASPNTFMSKWGGSSGTGDRAYRLEIATDKTLTLALGGVVDDPVDVNSTTVLTEVGTWYHVAATVNPGANTVRLYVNGTEEASDTTWAGQLGNSSFAFNLGQLTGGTQRFNGLIDEVRVSNTVRSADWLATQYTNQNNPAGFYTLCVEEAVVAPPAPTIVSNANQVFTVGDAATAIGTITLTDDDTSPIFTAANDLRIRIPSGFNMEWDTTDTSAVIGGAASAKVSATVTYDDSKTLVLDVTSDFAVLESITVSGLSFTNFTAVSAADFLELDVDNDATADATDDKTIQINAASGGGVCPAPGQTWYNASWLYRKPLSIDFNQVTADHTNFPVLVSLGSDADLAADAKANGDDILFTSSDGITKLSHEIEKFTSATGELVAWVKVPNLSSSGNTVLYMYYGNGAAANQEDVANVWSDYEAVYHLHDDFLDSTANNHDGTNFGTVDIAGKVADGQDFEGDDATDRVEIGTFSAGTGQALTLQAWAKWESFPTNDGRILSKASGGNNQDHVFLLGENAIGSKGSGNHGVRFRVKTGTDDSTGTTVLLSDSVTIPTGTWVHMAGTYDGSTMRVLQDGVEVGSTPKTGNLRANNWDLFMGNQPLTTEPRWMDGVLDEVRIAKAARTANWLRTEYNNYTDPVSFYTLCSEESSVPAPTPTISSGTNQTFTVGDPATVISTITITDDSSTATITTANDLRIRIPATFNMEWDTTITTVTLGGGAAGKVSTSGVTYEDANKTMVLNVTTDFAASDQVTISDLKFTNFTAVSAIDNLELVVAGAGGATADTDDKTIEVNAVSAPIAISSAANQTFTVGDPATAISTITVTDDAGTATITAANDLRIRIPATFNMEWDTSITTVTLGGGAASKVSTSGVTYEDSNKTMVLNVTTNFAASDQITIADLKFTNFTAASAIDNLELVVAGAGGATAATDDKTIEIVSASGACDVDPDGTYIEAENYTQVVDEAGTGYFEVESTTAGYNGTGYLKSINGTDPSDRYDYTVEFASTGTYYVWVRMYTTDIGLNSAWFGFDGTDLAQYRDIDVADQWRWTNTNSPNTFTVSSTGEHTLNLRQREQDLLTDGIYITTDSGAIPGGTSVGIPTGATVIDPSNCAAAVTITSTANQTFTVGDPLTAISMITITDDAASPLITAADDLRIHIPATFNMTWNTADISAVIGGAAAANVSATVSYADSRTLVLDVTSDFAAGDQITVSGLSFMSFSSASAADNLTLDVDNNATADASDDKTIEITAGAAAVTITSTANQSFTVGDPLTAISMVTITDAAASPLITAANDIRIRIPATFNMTWDSTDTAVSIGGAAASKVSGTVSYEDSDKTLVLDVTTNFAAGDVITVSGLSFKNFTAASNADNLELEIGNDDVVAALDDKTITVKLAANYRSIGIDSSILYQTGTATIAQGASTVTFSGATLPANIGVGDKLIIGPGSGGGSVAIDDVAPPGRTDATSITIPASTSGTDRLMLVGVSINNDDFETVLSITYNGVPLSFIDAVDNSDDARVEIWQLTEADGLPTGTDLNVVITFQVLQGGVPVDLDEGAVAGVMTFTGVDQTNPLGTFASNENDGNAASVTVSSAVGELVFAVMSGETVDSVDTDPPATERWNLSEPLATNEEFGAGATDNGAANVTFNWSLGSSDHWAAAGISIKPAPGAGETYYILSRDSDNQVTVQGTAASTLTNQTYTIERAYNTFQDWEDDRQGDLVADDRIEVGIAYDDGDFTGPATQALLVSGSTTDATHYMKLIVAENQRHDGTAGTGVVVDGADTTKHGVLIDDNYTQVQGLELKRFRSDNGAAGVFVNASATNVLLEDLLIHDFDSGTFSVSGIDSQDNSSFTIRNCIIYDGDTAGIRGGDLTSTGTIENCTIHGMATYGVFEDDATFTVTNTIAMNSGTDFSVVRGTQSHNVSSDATASGTGSLTNRLASNQFASLTAGSEDFHLKTGADAIGAGLNLSGTFTLDIDDQTRDCVWDMGADEAVILSSGVHFEITHDGTGINCQVEPITITVHDCAHNPLTSYAGTINLSTSTVHGDWSIVTGGGALNNGTVNDGAASYNFSVGDNGQVVLGLKDTYVETTNINISDGSLTEDAAEDPSLTFYEAGFNFLADAGTTIGTQIAGKASNVAPGAQTLQLQAIRTDTETGECKAALQGANVIGLAMQCKDPQDCTASQVTVDAGGGPVAIASNSTGSGLTFTGVSMDFGDATDDTATFFLSYPDAGQIQLHAQYTIPLGDGSASPNVMQGGSNQFVVRPFGFDIDFGDDRATNGTGGASYAADASGSLFKKAGEVFNATVTAVVWQSGDDANSDGLPDIGADLTDNAATPNFGQEKKPAAVNITHGLVEPVGQNVGTLQGGQNVSGFTSGALTTTLGWNEVGIISLTGNHLNYLKQSGINIAGAVDNVGRFYPARLDVTDNDPMLRDGTGAWSCSFTYMDQPFGYLTPPVFTITAKDISGNTTNNYGGSFWKFTGALASRGYANTVTGSTATFNAPIDGSVVLAGDTDYDGQGTLTVNNETFTYQRSSAPEAKFDARAQLTVTAGDLTDNDGVCRSTSNRTCNTGDGDTGEGYAITNVTGTELRFGRLVLESAFGSGLYALDVPLRTEYYDGTNFVPHTDDNCTAMSGTNLILSNDDQAAQTDGDILVGAATTTASIANNPYSLGDADLSFSPPGPTEDGYVDITVNLPGLGMTWLRYDWDGDGNHDDDPTARVSFGLFSGPMQFIYLREPWN